WLAGCGLYAWNVWGGHSCPPPLILVLLLSWVLSGTLHAGSIADRVSNCDERNQSQRQRTGVSALHKPAGNLRFQLSDNRGGVSAQRQQLLLPGRKAVGEAHELMEKRFTPRPCRDLGPARCGSTAGIGFDTVLPLFDS